MTSTVALDELQRQHAEAQAVAEAAAERLAAREAADLAAQMQRREEWDQHFVDSYRDQLAALDEEDRAARLAFYDTVMSDSVVAAWVEMRACRWRRSALISSMAGALVRLGREQEAGRYSAPDYRDPRLLEEIQEIAEDAAMQVATDEEQQRVDDREAHAAGQTS